MIIDGVVFDGLLSLDEIVRHPEMLAHQAPHEIKETLIACSAALAALNAAEAGCAPNTANPAGSGEGLIGIDEALAKYPGCFTRRQLFGGGLPFVKRTSPRKILIDVQGLKRWLDRRR